MRGILILYGKESVPGSPVNAGSARYSLMFTPTTASLRELHPLQQSSSTAEETSIYPSTPNIPIFAVHVAPEEAIIQLLLYHGPENRAATVWYAGSCHFLQPQQCALKQPCIM
ncbi:hypothetical protein J6590_012347 [Homalodisca vitripennis]|nr:hypothetical protein J6590_012347 [Homalodisca vitripennis]